LERKPKKKSIAHISEYLHLLSLDIKALGSVLSPEELWLHINLAHVMKTRVIDMDTKVLAH
jgi:hypothetical protein